MNDDNTPAIGPLTLMTKEASIQHGPLLTKMTRLKEALLSWIIFCHIAIFALVNGSYFRNMIAVLSEEIASMLPTRNIIRQWVLSKHEKQKKSYCVNYGVRSRRSISASIYGHRRIIML
jgi:hypothetical protein